MDKASSLKVLLCAPVDGHSDVYITEAFQDLGHSVEKFDYRTKSAEVGLDSMQEALLNASKDVDFTLILKGELIHPKTLQQIENNALWNFDCWTCQEPWFIKLAQATKTFFTPCGGMINMFRGMGINAQYLIEAASPKYHHPVVTEISRPVFGSDICFVGTVQGIPEREPWLRAIAERFPNRLKIWGSFGVEVPGATYHGRPPSEDKGLNYVVSSSKINLDYSRRPDIEGGFSARIFRTLAAKGFLLMKKVKNIEDILLPSIHLDTFETVSECINKIGYYLENESERKAVAETGYQEVVRNHTFVHRIQEMLGVIG